MPQDALINRDVCNSRTSIVTRLRNGRKPRIGNGEISFDSRLNCACLRLTELKGPFFKYVYSMSYVLSDGGAEAVRYFLTLFTISFCVLCNR